MDRPDEELLSLYRTMVERLPEDPTALSDYAWFLAQRDLELETAAEAARRAVALAPDQADPLDTLAEVLFRLGRTAEAVATIEKAVRLEPGNVHYREQRLRFVRAFRAETAPADPR
jgi:cytochrome c-type biogenesis protein CcmH/NrfG